MNLREVQSRIESETGAMYSATNGPIFFPIEHGQSHAYQENRTGFVLQFRLVRLNELHGLR